MARERIVKLIALALAGAGLGLSGFPLGWMLGPAAVGLGLAVYGRSVPSDGRVGDFSRAILGAAIGGSVTTAHIQWLIGSPELLLLVALNTLLVAAVSFIWLTRFCGWSSGAAYFSSLPGGLSEMVELAATQRVEPALVALAHTLRIFILVAGASGLIALLKSVDLQDMSFGVADLESTLTLGLCVLVGLPLGRLCRLPAPSVMGPLALAVLCTLGLGVTPMPPTVLIIAAQLGIGWSLARRFAGIAGQPVMRLFIQVTVQLLLVLPCWGLIAGLALNFTSLDGMTAVLGLAPGGQAEVALLSLLVGASAISVVMLHLMRVLMILSFAGLGYRWVRRGRFDTR